MSVKKSKSNRLQDYFVNPDNAEECLNLFSDVLAEGIDFKINNKKNKPVVNYKEQDVIMKDLIEPIPLNPKDIREVIKECKTKIVDGSVNFSSKNFMAFPDNGNSVAAICGHLLYGMLNQNMGSCRWGKKQQKNEN